MPSRERRAARAARRNRELVELAARELLLARTGAGITQAVVSRVAGISRSQYGRIERGELRGVTLEQLCRSAAAVGLRPTLRFYPDDDPLRDTPQQRLLGRVRERVAGGVGWQTEVGLPGAAERRAWDVVLTFPTCRDAVEGESKVIDGQATWRRASLKRRDDPGITHLFLVVADTPRNRRAVGQMRDLLRPDLPLDTRAILRAFAEGRCPGASGIVFV